MNIEVSKPKKRSYSVVWWYGSITKAAFTFFSLLSAGHHNQQQIQVLVAALKAKFSQIWKFSHKLLTPKFRSPGVISGASEQNFVFLDLIVLKVKEWFLRWEAVKPSLQSVPPPPQKDQKSEMCWCSPFTEIQANPGKQKKCSSENTITFCSLHTAEQTNSADSSFFFSFKAELPMDPD